MARRAGGFGTAFSQAFAAMMNAVEAQRHNRALEDHWARIDGKLTPSEIEAAAIGRVRGEGMNSFDSRGDGGGAYKGGAQAEAHAAEMSEYLQKNYGLSKAGAAGVVGNAWQESNFASNFKPGGDKGSASGMFQWRGDRQTDARNWMEQNNKDPNDWRSHLDFAMHETARDYPSMMNQLKTTNDPSYATREFFHVFERGDPKQANFANREGMANAAMKGGVPATTETAATTPTKGPNKGKTPPTKAATADEPSKEAQPVSVSVGTRDNKFLLPGSDETVPEDTRTPEQMNQDSPAPPPGAAMPRNERALPTPEQAPSPPSDRTPISTIPPGPTVPAQDAAPVMGPQVPPGGITTEVPEGAARPDAPITNTPQPIVNAARPDAPGMGSRGLPPAPQFGPNQRADNGDRPDLTGRSPISAVRPEPPVPVGTINANTDKSPVNMGPATRADDGSRPDLTARSTPTPAQASVQTQPALPPRPTQPAQDPRFVQVTAPNSDPTARNRPQMTALNLNLWGSNPPVAQQQAVTPQSNVRRPDDDLSGVTPSAPNMDDVSLGMQLGARKGGPITPMSGAAANTRRSGGVNRFAAGGAIPARPTTGFAVGGTAMPAVGGRVYSPVDPRTATSNAIGTLLYGNPRGGNDPGMTLQQYHDKINALTPDQQSWLTAQQHLLDNYPTGNPMDPNVASMRALYDAQFNSTAPPGAAPAAAAPAAAAPAAAATSSTAAPSISQINPAAKTPDLSADTTTTAGPVTGAFKLPNTVTPKTPNFINPDTGETSNSPESQNVGGTDYTVTPKGDTSQNVAQPGGFRRGGAIGYDDGGGVSPTAIGGMPPGLGGQGAIPPIYYNGATYAGAGAPVGKGISQNSAGTSVAGAIPSLPMAKGGAVGFDDGGSVDDYTGQDAESQAVGPETGNARGAPAPVAAPVTTPRVTPESNYVGATGPQDVHPDLPAWTPQIKDDQGNPSRGVIGAIAGGLHYLASQLGLGGDGGQRPAMAQDPNTSVNRTNFASGQGVEGAPMPSQADMHTLHSAMGTDGLTSGMRNLAGMEAVRNYYLVQGEPDKADKMAASMLQYSVSLAQQHGDEAARRYYDGDLKGAVEQLNHASEAIADGNDYKAELAPDGKHVVLSNRDLNGREIWKAKVAPQEILSAALGMKDGSLAWSAYEAQAAKYDPATQQMIRDRNQQKTWQHQQDVTDQKAQAKEDAAAAQAKGLNTVLEGMHKPRGAPAPGLPPAPGAAPVLNSPSKTVVPDQAPTSADQGAPPSPSAQGSAQSATLPTDADQTGAPAPTPAPAVAPAIPSGPTAALPAAQPSEPPPTRPDEVEGYASLAPAQANEAWKTYQAEYAQWHQNQVDQQREGRMDRREAFTQDQLNRREQFTQDQTRRTNEEHDRRVQQAEQEKVRLARVSPMDERTLQSKFDTNPDPATGAVGKEPADWLAASHYGRDANGQPVALPQAKQAMGQEFDDATGKGGAAKVDTLGKALINTQRMNSHISTDQLADALTGMASGKYVYASDPKPISDTWGDRYSVVVARPDGSGQMSMLVPESDLNDIIRIRGAQAEKVKAGAATANAAANPYQGPAISPAPRRAPSPTTGQESGPTVRPGMLTGQPAPTTNPVGDWWQNMLHPKPMARGRGYNASP